MKITFTSNIQSYVESARDISQDRFGFELVGSVIGSEFRATLAFI